MILYIAGKLAPNSPHFTKGLVKYVHGRGYFRAVPSQNGDKHATSPTPPIVERLLPRVPWLLAELEGALGLSYSSRVHLRKLHHALRMRRSTSMDRSTLWSTFSPRYTGPLYVMTVYYTTGLHQVLFITLYTLHSVSAASIPTVTLNTINNTSRGNIMGNSNISC